MNKIFILSLLYSYLIFAQYKTVVITVDGLKLDKVVKEQISQYCEKYNTNSWGDYLGDAVREMGFGNSIDLYSFPWSRDALISKFEVDNLSKFIHQILNKKENINKKIVILSHSWGTVLTYAALNRLNNENKEIDLLITLGSPLGSEYLKSSVIKRITKYASLAGSVSVLEENIVLAYIASKFSELGIDGNRCPKNIKKWINYWNFGDLFSGPVNERCALAEDRTFDNEITFKKYKTGRNIWGTYLWHGFNSLQKNVADVSDKRIDNSIQVSAVKNLIKGMLNSTGFICGSSNIQYQGQNYNTVKIASQCWLKENLNVGTIIQGKLNQKDNGKIEKYCYNNDPANCEKYGGLYQWDEAMQYTKKEKAQGICPDGWHIPTKVEFEILRKNNLGSEGTFFAENQFNISPKDTYGLSIYLAGMIQNRVFEFLGYSTAFWGSNLDCLWSLDTGNHSPINGYFNSGFWPDGASVRCLQD